MRWSMGRRRTMSGFEIVLAGGKFAKIWRMAAFVAAAARPGRRPGASQLAVDRRRDFRRACVKRWPGYALDRCLARAGELDQPPLPAVKERWRRFFGGAEYCPVAGGKGLGLFFFESVAEAMQATVEFLDL